MSKHIIDATNKKLGRVASEAAAILNGKNSTGFARNTVTHSVVLISNASKADISAKKLLQKKYDEFDRRFRNLNIVHEELQVIYKLVNNYL